MGRADVWIWMLLGKIPPAWVWDQGWICFPRWSDKINSYILPRSQFYFSSHWKLLNSEAGLPQLHFHCMFPEEMLMSTWFTIVWRFKSMKVFHVVTNSCTRLFSTCSWKVDRIGMAVFPYSSIQYQSDWSQPYFYVDIRNAWAEYCFGQVSNRVNAAAQCYIAV